ncbi:hypothetical protein BGY98DRAFT_1101474 [Russula aff. rugulosa BPL654]|nr:hypothetical protein BGY98DRAFT_1101474 [Russula aff. rugulosa BPL654]
MQRYKIVARIILIILSVINFTLAAPVSVQRIRVDVARDVTTGSRKRWDPSDTNAADKTNSHPFPVGSPPAHNDLPLGIDLNEPQPSLSVNSHPFPAHNDLPDLNASPQSSQEPTHSYSGSYYSTGSSTDDYDSASSSAHSSYSHSASSVSESDVSMPSWAWYENSAFEFPKSTGSSPAHDSSELDLNRLLLAEPSDPGSSKRPYRPSGPGPSTWGYRPQDPGPSTWGYYPQDPGPSTWGHHPQDPGPSTWGYHPQDPGRQHGNHPQDPGPSTWGHHPQDPGPSTWGYHPQDPGPSTPNPGSPTRPHPLSDTKPSTSNTGPSTSDPGPSTGAHPLSDPGQSTPRPPLSPWPVQYESENIFSKLLRGRFNRRISRSRSVNAAQRELRGSVDSREYVSASAFPLPPTFQLPWS